MAGRSPQSRNEKLRRYFLIQGIVDGLETEVGVRAAFEAWDAQLGLSAKARRLAAADRKVREVSATRRRAALLRDRDAEDRAFTSAAMGEDLWGSGLGKHAADVVREEIEWLSGPREPWSSGAERGSRYPCGCVEPRAASPLEVRRCTMHRILFDCLSSRLVDRFVRWAATRGGWPIEPAPEIPDAWDTTVGERLTLTIPADYPVWIARDWLERFHRRALATLAAAERAGQEPGRPVARDRTALRRMGRTYFLLDLKRRPRPRRVDVGREYDAASERKHDGMHCRCHQEIARDVKRAAELLTALEL